LEPLRAAHRRRRRASGAVLLGFAGLYVLPAVAAPSLPGLALGGGLSLGLLLVLLQLPLTVVALVVHERSARSRIDPLVDRYRELSEGEEDR
jgi:hypothetical protein